MASFKNKILNLMSSPTHSPVQNDDMCEICHQRPKYLDSSGIQHAYCGKRCSRLATADCILPGCRSPAKSAFSNFCSGDHAREGVRLGHVARCKQCRIMPQSAGSLCLSCAHQSRALPAILPSLLKKEPPNPNETYLEELNLKDSSFKQLQKDLMRDWNSRSPSGTPEIHKIYEVKPQRDVLTRHGKYGSKGSIEIRTYQSSLCTCDLGTKGPTLCALQSCGICMVTKSSFKSFAFREKYNTGRFGGGIYSYQDPSHADHFATSCTSSPYRVMIACDTIIQPGQSHQDKQESTFVPVAEAILPRFIIMYILSK